MDPQQLQALINALNSQKQRSPWLDAALAFGPALIQGVGGAAQSSAQRQQDLENQAYQRRLGARSGLAAFYQDQLGRDISGAQALSNAMPLGAEQALAEQMGRRRALGQVAANWQPPRGMSPAANAFAAQTPNLLAGFASPDYQQTVSREATARSIAERRKALAGLDPNFQFGSMADYGMPDLGGEVSGYAGDVRSRRQASESQLLQLLQQQMQEAQGGATGATGASGTGAAPKKTAWWRKALGTALPVAAAFIPGVGPVASIALQAAAGAAGGAIGGGGVKGAVLGGLMGGVGAGTGGLGSAAGRKVLAEQGAKAFAKQALLNPRALTQIAGGALGGERGAALQAASLGMPGMKASPYEQALQTLGQSSPQGQPSINALIQEQIAGLAPQSRMSIDYSAATPPQTFGGWDAMGGLFAPTPTTPEASVRQAVLRPPPRGTVKTASGRTNAAAGIPPPPLPALPGPWRPGAIPNPLVAQLPTWAQQQYRLLLSQGDVRGAQQFLRGITSPPLSR